MFQSTPPSSAPLPAKTESSLFARTTKSSSPSSQQRLHTKARKTSGRKGIWQSFFKRAWASRRTRSPWTRRQAVHAAHLVPIYTFVYTSRSLRLGLLLHLLWHRRLWPLGVLQHVMRVGALVTLAVGASAPHSLPAYAPPLLLSLGIVLALGSLVLYRHSSAWYLEDAYSRGAQYLRDNFSWEEYRSNVVDKTTWVSKPWLHLVLGDAWLGEAWKSSTTPVMLWLHRAVLFSMFIVFLPAFLHNWRWHTLFGCYPSVEGHYLYDRHNRHYKGRCGTHGLPEAAGFLHWPPWVYGWLIGVCLAYVYVHISGVVGMLWVDTHYTQIMRHLWDAAVVSREEKATRTRESRL